MLVLVIIICPGPYKVYDSQWVLNNFSVDKTIWLHVLLLNIYVIYFLKD